MVMMKIIEVTMIKGDSDNHIGNSQVHCAATWCQSRKPMMMMIIMIMPTMMIIYVIIVAIIIILMVMMKIMGGDN